MTEYEIAVLEKLDTIITQNQDTAIVLNTITTHILFLALLTGVTMSILIAMWFVRKFILGNVRSFIKF